MEETVTITRKTYDDMKSKIERLQSENSYLSQCDSGGVCKLTFSGAYGIQTVEYRPMDEAVALINKQVISEMEDAKEHVKQKTLYWKGIEHEIERLNKKIKCLEWWKFWK